MGVAMESYLQSCTKVQLLSVCQTLGIISRKTWKKPDYLGIINKHVAGNPFLYRGIVKGHFETNTKDLTSKTVPWTIPKKVLDEFVKASQPMKKTRNDIEFMGFLLGTIEEDTKVVKVTCVFIPKQAGECDKVGQTSEKTNLALLNASEKHNACLVGWVHSHPTFDAYLSSVDLHQHAQIQDSVDHAVAVVFDKNDDPSFVHAPSRWIDDVEAL